MLIWRDRVPDMEQRSPTTIFQFPVYLVILSKCIANFLYLHPFSTTKPFELQHTILWNETWVESSRILGQLYCGWVCLVWMYMLVYSVMAHTCDDELSMEVNALMMHHDVFP